MSHNAHVQFLFAIAAAVIPVPASAAIAQMPPGDGMILWLDAEDPDGDGNTGNLPDDGSSIAEWRDRSGAGNQLTQRTAAHQPTFHLNAVGGRPAVRFHGDDLLSLPHLIGLTAGDAEFHVLVVMQAPAGTSHPAQRILDLNSRDADSAAFEKRFGFWVGFQQNRGRVRLGIHHGDEGEGQTVAWNGKPNLIETVYTGEQTFAIHVNGHREQRAVFNGTHFLGFRKNLTLAIGQHFGMESNPGTFYQGDVAEVLIYNRPLTATERYDIGSYLAEKYALQTDFRPIPHFERDVQPILAQRCLGCHGGETPEADLDLRTVSSMLRGGTAGPVIVRGFPDRSEMIAMIEAQKMPPKDKEPLTPYQISVLRDWVEADAPAAEPIASVTLPNKITEEDRTHWAWQHLLPQDPPAVEQADRVQNEIDQFVLAKLEQHELTYSPEADRNTLVRRACFDLTGLPPSVADVDGFVSDQSADAYEHLIDRLLDSPHFGERWGRHWLDVTGYVDVYGSDNDFAIIKPLAEKWRYRDYVIRSLNDDKPFDRFIVEQLAGDELEDWKSAETFSPATVEALTATAFLLCANDDTDQNELNTPETRHHVLQRTTEIIAANLLAMTLQCARCHDHKYEAISQADYYRLESVFAPAFNVRDWIVSTGHARADVSDRQQAEIDRNNGLNSQPHTYGTIQVVHEHGPPPPTHVLRRGDYMRPGLEVIPALPAILDSAPLEVVPLSNSSGRRLALARALTNSDTLAGQHVARVIVNRLWQQIFGTGIVATSDNFGVSGSLPSHPELLDDLTMRFIENGWRVKPIIKRMMMSAAYRQQSSLSPDSTAAQQIDPGNRLLWRMTLRQRDSESIRDAILVASGKLDRTVFGPFLPLEARADGMVVIKEEGLPTPTSQWRRSIYVLARRNYHLTMLSVMGQPVVARNCTVRQPSAIVTQSLTLLHDDFVLNHADYFAERIIGEAADNVDDQVTAAFRIALGRSPTEEELQLSKDLIERQRSRYSTETSETELTRTALAQLCKMLFNLNEFLYVN